MKQLYLGKIILILVFLFLASFSNAQSSITIGNSTATQNPPFDASDYFSRSVSLYAPIAFTGTITKLLYNISEVNEVDSLPIHIWLKETGLSFLPDSVKWEDITENSQKVMDSKILFSHSGWYSISLGSSAFLKIYKDLNLQVSCEQWGKKFTSGGSAQPEFTCTNANYHGSPLHVCKNASDSGTLKILYLNSDSLLPDIKITYITDPDTLKTTSTSSTSIHLAWEGLHIQNYLILRNLSSDFPVPLQGQSNPWTNFNPAMKVYNGPGNTKVDTGLTPGTKYYYKFFGYYQDTDDNKYYYSPGIVDSAETRCFDVQNLIHFENGIDHDTFCYSPGTTIVIIGTDMPFAKYSWEKSNNGTQWHQLPDSLSDLTVYADSSRLYRRYVAIPNTTCSDTSNIATLLVSPLSSAGILTLTNDTVCTSETSDLNVTGYVGDIMKWQWKKNTGDWHDTLVTDPSLSLTNNNPGTFYYRVVVKSEICDPVTSDSIKLLVNVKPTILFDAPESICEGSELSVAIQTNQGSQIHWRRDKTDEVAGINNNGNSSLISGIPVFNNPSGENIIVTFNVYDTLFTCVTVDSFQIIIKSSPLEGKIVGDTKVCRNMELSYSLQPVPQNDISYEWQLDGTSIGKDSSGVNIFWDSPGDKLLSVKKTNNQSLCTASESLNITVSQKSALAEEKLLAKITSDKDSLFLLCQNNITNVQEQGYRFKWGYNKKDNPESIYWIHTYDDKYFCRFPNYDVILYDYFVDEYPDLDTTIKCSTRTYYNPLKTAFYQDPFISVYPNPFNNIATLKIGSNCLGNFNIEILSIYGSCIYNHDFYKSCDEQEFPMALGFLSPGVYFVKCITADGNRYQTKIIKY